MTLDPTFHFLEVAYPYIARRLLTDEDPALRERLIQVIRAQGSELRLHAAHCPTSKASSQQPVPSLELAPSAGVPLHACFTRLSEAFASPG